MTRHRNTQELPPHWLDRELDRKEYAKKIAPARKAAGLTQAELASMAGVSLNTIGNVERGDTIPQPGKLWPILKCLSIGPGHGFSDRINESLDMIGGLMESLREEDIPVVTTKIMKVILEEIRSGSATNVIQMPSQAPSPDFSKLEAASRRDKETIEESPE